jgi:hypothetical protein
VDDRVGGVVALEIYIQTHDDTNNHLAIGFVPAHAQHNELGANMSSSRYSIDGMDTITALQLQASRASGERQLGNPPAAQVWVVDLAARAEQTR